MLCCFIKTNMFALIVVETHLVGRRCHDSLAGGETTQTSHEPPRRKKPPSRRVLCFDSTESRGPMPYLVSHLKRFNRKERFYLIGSALGNATFRLGDDVRHRLSKLLDLFIPADAFVAMDYPLDWLLASMHLAVTSGTAAPIFVTPGLLPAPKRTLIDSWRSILSTVPMSLSWRPRVLPVTLTDSSSLRWSGSP